MSWSMEEAVSFYRSQGAPGDQSALISLLREVQRECGGSIPGHMLSPLAYGLEVKETFLRAVIKRIPSLRMGDEHFLELCAGPNCSKAAALASQAEALAKEHSVTLKFVPCMRMCGKGPNLRWDGVLYHKADTALLKRLICK